MIESSGTNSDEFGENEVLKDEVTNKNEVKLKGKHSLDYHS